MTVRRLRQYMGPVRSGPLRGKDMESDVRIVSAAGGKYEHYEREGWVWVPDEVKR